MKGLVNKLQLLAPVISEICSIGGNAGLSLGVLHRGEIIHTAHFGHRDVEAQIPPDSDTVYYIASLTKAITSAAMGILVEEGKTTWDTLVSDVIPDFHQRSEAVNSATIVDLLAHRTGIAGKNCAWIQANQRLLMPKNQTIQTCNYLEPVTSFREKWKYTNWGYGLAGEIIEKISGESYPSFIQKRIFEPLGMERSTADIPSSENLATPYMVMDDGTPYKIPHPQQAADKVLAAAGGVKSSVSDMLLFYQSILSANTYQMQQNSGTGHTPVLKQVETIFAPHIPIGTSSIRDQSYGLGWVRTQLPGSLGLIGMNDMYLGGMPPAGRTSKSLVLHHNGNLSGFLSSIHLIPDTETAIIVMSNSMPFTDPADFIGQLVLETILDEKKPNDYVKLSKDSRDAHVASYPALVKELESGLGEPAGKPLDQYTGRYYNSIGNFVLDVSKTETGLHMTIQDFDDVAFDLKPYAGHTFWWGPPDREAEECKQAMFPRTYAGYHLIHFQVSDNGDIESIVWAHDPDLPEGETFARKTTTSSQAQADGFQKVLKPL